MTVIQPPRAVDVWSPGTSGTTMRSRPVMLPFCSPEPSLPPECIGGENVERLCAIIKVVGFVPGGSQLPVGYLVGCWCLGVGCFHVPLGCTPSYMCL